MKPQPQITLFQTMRTGFTLIELLVVIAIISILTAVIYANFNDARTLAKNKALRSELRETQLAIEVYEAQYDVYPGDLSDLTPDFIADLPNANDAANDACVIEYDPTDGTVFKLTAVNCIGGASEASEGVQPDDELARCADYCGSGGYPSCPVAASSASFYESLAVYSAGGECLE